jgi:hypothetical protein
MDEELEKLYQELINNRITYRGQGLVQVSPPQAHQSLIANPLRLIMILLLYILLFRRVIIELNK